MLMLVPVCEICYGMDMILYRCPDCKAEVCSSCLISVTKGLPITIASFLCKNCYMTRKRIKKRLVCECGWKGKPMASDVMIATIGGILGCPECAKANRNPTLECQHGHVQVVYDKHRHKPKHIKYVDNSIIQGCTICQSRRLIMVGTGRIITPKAGKWVTKHGAIKLNLSWLWRYGSR